MTTYHAPHFDPTVDEIETLKQLEMGQVITLPHALKDHVSGRRRTGHYAQRSATDSPTRQLV